MTPTNTRTYAHKYTQAGSHTRGHTATRNTYGVSVDAKRRVRWARDVHFAIWLHKRFPEQKQRDTTVSWGLGVRCLEVTITRSPAHLVASRLCEILDVVSNGLG